MPTAHPLSRRKRIVFSCMLGAFVLAAVECTSWLFLVFQQEGTKPVSMSESIYQPHTYIGYTLRPGARDESYFDGYLAINSAGYRGPELMRGKDRVRIVCLGGSTTFSIRVGNDTTYPRLLEQKLRETYGSDEIEVVNAGVGAYTSAESLANLAFRVLGLQPDVLIVYHAVNDVHPRVTPGFQADHSHYRKAMESRDDWLTALQRFSGFARVLNRSRMKSMHVRHMTTHVKFEDIPPDDQLANFRRTDSSAFERNIESMIALAKARNVDVVLSTFTYSKENLRDTEFLSYEAYSEGIAQHDDVMKRLASRHGLPLVDVAARFPDERTELYSGSVHLVSAGTEIKAQIFHDELVASHVLEKHLQRPSSSGSGNTDSPPSDSRRAGRGGESRH